MLKVEASGLLCHMVNIILGAQLSQFSTVTLQIKPVSNSWSLKGKLSFPPSPWSEPHVACVSWFAFVCGVCMYVQYVSTEAQRWWSSVGGLSWPRGCWGDNAFLQAAPQVYSPATALSLLWSCVNRAAGWGSMADPGVSTSSNRNKATARALNHSGDVDDGCSCFHFTPLEWTHAESKQPPYT